MPGIEPCQLMGWPGAWRMGWRGAVEVDAVHQSQVACELSGTARVAEVAARALVELAPPPALQDTCSSDPM
eukprot:770985-Alexandrium_andersonii.AAC.1